MTKNIITPYNDIKDSLQTFDIINCVYGDNWLRPSHWIMGAIGHTAMVYVDRESGKIFIYESTRSKRADGLTGVRLRPMEEWVNMYPGRIYLRQVTFSSDVIFEGQALRESAERKCGYHIKLYKGTPYPDLAKFRWLWFLINAKIDLPKGSVLNKKFENPDIDFVMFCAHLVGHVFKWCGLAVPDMNSAELEPDDFRQLAMVFIAYLKDYISLGEEIQLK